MSISDTRIAISTELSLGDMVQQLFDGIITDLPTTSEVDALVEVVKLITANYSGSKQYPALIEEIYHHLKNDFVHYGHVEVAAGE